MVVRRRTLVCPSATVARRRAGRRTRRARRITPSFYFAHRHSRDDYGQRQEEERAGDLTYRVFAMQGGEDVADGLKWRDRAGSDKNREKNAGDRSACNQPRAEERTGADFRF